MGWVEMSEVKGGVVCGSGVRHLCGHGRVEPESSKLSGVAGLAACARVGRHGLRGDKVMACPRPFAIRPDAPAVVSVVSNIAEGDARGTNRDALRFLQMARGSLAELETQEVLCVDLRYLDPRFSANCRRPSTLREGYWADSSDIGPRGWKRKT